MKPRTKRIQFEFAVEAIDDLDTLQLLTKSATRTETVRKALRFYEYCARRSNEGYKIELSKGKDKETLAPILVF